MDTVYYLIGLPIAFGLLCLLFSDRFRNLIWSIAFIMCSILFVAFIFFFSNIPVLPSGIFIWDGLTNLALLGTGFFGLVICFYSKRMVDNYFGRYYGYLLITLGASTGAVLSNNLILMAVFWGILAITLYLMINLGGPEASYPAKKTLIIVGGSDSFLVLGIAMLWVLTGSFNITEMNVQIDRWFSAAAFLCLVCASFAKAGAMPFHTWIPEISESAPVSVMAFFPASLDKLLGIYLFSRICLNIFSYHESMWFLLRLLGSITIVGAVFLALVQHNMKRLLAYHAVSQVGYMVVGIASGNPVGIAGGLFHMINNAIYKCCLFLGAGSIEKQAGSTELDNLGGLGKNLPLTFLSFLFASFAISGIPPFNGFFSKWMIYQGLVEGYRNGDQSWILWIIMAMIGSGLTLASFMKIIHATFLGHTDETIRKKGISEPHWTALLPLILLAFLCLFFGMFYASVPLERFIFPVIKITGTTNVFSLILPLIFIICGITFGILLYPILVLGKIRRVPSFIGGERPVDNMRITGTEFYNLIKIMPFLRKVYDASEKRFTDIYDVLKSLVAYFTEALRVIHTGILGTYLTWMLFGTLILFYIFIKW